MTVHTFGKVALATTLFAVVHSALASRQVKQLAGKLIGETRRDATYRVFFNSQALLGFTLLIAYGARLPSKVIYRVHGPAAAAMRVGQLAGIAYLAAALKQLGVTRFAGVRNVRAWLQGAPVPAGPVAQGPEPGQNGKLDMGGAFRLSQHPLNFAAMPLFWLTPRMTSRRLAFNLVSSIYFLVGSLHEAARLRHAHGESYRAYEKSQVPFYWPRLKAAPLRRPVIGA